MRTASRLKRNPRTREIARLYETHQRKVIITVDVAIMFSVLLLARVAVEFAALMILVGAYVTYRLDKDREYLLRQEQQQIVREHLQAEARKIKRRGNRPPVEEMANRYRRKQGLDKLD